MIQIHGNIPSQDHHCLQRLGDGEWGWSFGNASCTHNERYRLENYSRLLCEGMRNVSASGGEIEEFGPAETLKVQVIFPGLATSERMSGRGMT